MERSWSPPETERRQRREAEAALPRPEAALSAGPTAPAGPPRRGRMEEPPGGHDVGDVAGLLQAEVMVRAFDVCMGKVLDDAFHVLVAGGGPVGS